MRHVVRTLTLVSALAVAGPVHAQEVLRWGLQAGDTWQYQLTQNTSISNNPVRDPDSGQLAGESIQQSQVQTTTIEAAVRQVEANGNATVDWTYTRVQMSADGMPGLSFSWDSDDPDQSAADSPLGSMATQMGAMIGQTLTVVMTPLGEVLEVRGREAMLAAMLEGVDPAVAGMMAGLFEEMLGEDGMASEFLGSLGTLPERPLAVGDSWTNQSEITVPMLGSMTTETRNTISGFENRAGERVALILHEGTIEFDTSALGDGLPMTMTVDDTSVTGSSTFSLDRGMILSSTNTTEQVMTMSMPSAGMRQQMRTENTTLLDLVGPVTGGRD